MFLSCCYGHIKSEPRGLIFVKWCDQKIKRETERERRQRERERESIYIKIRLGQLFLNVYTIGLIRSPISS